MYFFSILQASVFLFITDWKYSKISNCFKLIKYRTKVDDSDQDSEILRVQVNGVKKEQLSNDIQIFPRMSSVASCVYKCAPFHLTVQLPVECERVNVEIIETKEYFTNRTRLIVFVIRRV